MENGKMGGGRRKSVWIGGYMKRDQKRLFDLSHHAIISHVSIFLMFVSSVVSSPSLFSLSKRPLLTANEKPSLLAAKTHYSLSLPATASKVNHKNDGCRAS